MVLMISSALKPAVTRLINPLARAALRVGLTPNSVTILGALGLIISAAYFYSKEEYFVGTLVITVFALSDLFDGAMARITDECATSWGGFLDTTIDRLTDRAIVISLALPLIRDEDLLAYPAVVALVTGVLIPYIRAKAESFIIAFSVGITERTERLVIILVAAGFHGLDVPYILAIGIWTLAVLGLVTVLQRLQVVRKGLADS